ncbi:alpha/beta hydrolase family protein [Mycolicibacterium xanthum]|uniref:alpha/beta hydrolase family protein n=1 Tax=Mycolicibacterium xanthum TaxID=2796469 RepID=UPI0021044744|nr:alpha/beta fold hydrolase [Mycolicibacterium xanthum]
MKRRNDVGTGRFFRDQTYHHALLRALNQVVTHGADISEVLQASTHMRSGDEQNWYAQWSALAERNVLRAEAVHNARSRGEALLRAHTYYTRAQFFLPPTDPKRPAAYRRCRDLFYAALQTLGTGYERIAVPYLENHLDAVYYPAPHPASEVLIVFHGGYDTIVEELYFFLAAEANSRGFSVLTFDGPGQGQPLRDQGLRFTHEWEKPTSAVLDAFTAAHGPPEKVVLVGLSLGGCLAPRAAAFEPRIDGVVSYGVLFDMHSALLDRTPSILRMLRRLGCDGLVDALARRGAAFDPGVRWGLANAEWTLGSVGLSGMLDAAKSYTLSDVAERIHQDVLILAGTEDQFIPLGQVERYRESLINARSVTTRVYDRASGGQEHSQLGAPTLWQADFFDWVAEKFG